jgi:DNA end-binding protein Ku
VIRDAMKDKDRVALARIVMAHREHLMALEPLGKGILGTTLRYDYEVREERPYFADVPSPRISREMVKLAEHILDTKAGRFDARKFKDQYELALRRLVKRKAAGKTIEAPEPPPERDNVINLMEALRRSIKGGRGGRTKAAPRKRIAAKRRRKAA